jgi:hydrogenase-1 operon protein HyaF
MAFMSGLSDIPVEVNAADQPPSPALLALLEELKSMLEQLARQGVSDRIDIRSLPFLPGDYEQLERILGDGEVNVTIDSLGPSTIRETAIPGIWWTTHRNADDEILTELIEVTELPDLLKTPQEDIVEAPARLQKILQQLASDD